MDPLPPYDNNPPGPVMFEPFLVPEPTLDLMAGVSLADVAGVVRITEGVGRSKGSRYASVHLTGVFSERAGLLWRTADARRVPYETALVGIPSSAWRFSDRLDEDLALERLREYERHAARPYCQSVWNVFRRLDPAMSWAGQTRSIREKAWLTLARATRVAAGEARSCFPAWYSNPMDEAIRALYPHLDTIVACACQWLVE